MDLSEPGYEAFVFSVSRSVTFDFACLELDAPDAQNVNSFSAADGKWVEAGDEKELIEFAS